MSVLVNSVSGSMLDDDAGLFGEARGVGGRHSHEADNDEMFRRPQQRDNRLRMTTTPYKQQR